jgi:hypothetical protein
MLAPVGRSGCVGAHSRLVAVGILQQPVQANERSWSLNTSIRVDGGEEGKGREVRDYSIQDDSENATSVRHIDIAILPRQI